MFLYGIMIHDTCPFKKETWDKTNSDSTHVLMESSCDFAYIVTVKDNEGIGKAGKIFIEDSEQKGS